MTEQPAEKPATDDLDDTPTGQLEQLLEEAEKDIAAIRTILHDRRMSTTRKSIEAMPKDLSTVQGKWADLSTFLQELLKKDDEAK